MWRSKETAVGPHHRLPEAEVEIEVEWGVTETNTGYALEKIREGERLNEREIGALVRSGKLGEDDWTNLRGMENRGN